MNVVYRSLPDIDTALQLAPLLLAKDAVDGLVNLKYPSPLRHATLDELCANHIDDPEFHLLHRDL